MGNSPKFIKDAEAILDYQIDWTTWLAADTISTSAWTLPTGITKVSDTKTITTTTIWLSGGTAGTQYDIVNKIVTTGGRTEERTLRIEVSQR